MKRNIFLSLIIMTAVSCDLPFDLKVLGDKDMLRLYCEVASGDTTVVDVDVLVPVGYHDRTPSAVGPENVVMTVDGRPVDLKVAGEDDPELAPGTIYAVEDFPGGSEICLKASADGAGSIEARTVMPLPLDGFSIEMELTDIVSNVVYGDHVRNVVRARLVLPEVADGTYIGVRQIVRCKTDSCGVMLGESQFMQPLYDVSQLSSDSDLGYNVDFSSLQQMGDTSIYVFDGTGEYEFMFHHCWDNESEWEDENGNPVVWSNDYQFCFMIYAISYEYYQYHTRTTNQFFDLGMASPSYTYTNVYGGTGFLGALCCVGTRWLDDKVFECSDSVVVRGE